jgi:hypothetical protein
MTEVINAPVLETSATNWQQVHMNHHDIVLPWQTFQCDPAILASRYGSLTQRAIYLDGFQAVDTGVDREGILWCGFSGQAILDAATFGNRKGTHAVTTADMENPRLLSHNPAHYAFTGGIEAVPAVVALRGECLRRNRFRDGPSAYHLRRGTHFDDAVAALLIARP